MHSSLPFDEWKELQINATAEKVRKAKEEQSGDIGLRLYGLSYRLALVGRAIEGVRELQLCMRMLVDLNACRRSRSVSVPAK